MAPLHVARAWSNLYRRYALAMDAADRGQPSLERYPGIDAGVEGVRWVDAGAVWVDYV